MARGDAIVWYGSMTDSGTQAALQPGSGVEICITSMSADIYVYFGTGNSKPSQSIHIPIWGNSSVTLGSPSLNTKIFATNTSYPAIISGTSNDTTYYASGIVTKA